MPTVEFDTSLIPQTYRRAMRHSPLTLEERIAINLFARRRAPVSILAKVFQCSRNTCYYSAISGEASASASFPASQGGKEVNALIDKMGEKRAWDRYVTDDMIRAVNATMKSRKAFLTKAA